MTTETKSNEQETKKQKVVYRGGASDAVYAFGILGAWFYYLTHATTILMGILGLIKGLFWPALIVYELLKYINP